MKSPTPKEHLKSRSTAKTVSESTSVLAIAVDGTEGSIRRAAEIILNKKPDDSGAIHGVRKLRHGLTGKRVTYFRSAINECSLPTESDLERQHCLHLERAFTVDRYRTQPFTVVHGGNHYTPDILVLWSNGAQSVLEVKPHGQFSDPQIKQKLDIFGPLIQDSGLDFQRVSEKDIHADSFNELLRHIYDGRTRLRVPAQLKALVDAIFAGRERLTLDTFSMKLVEAGWPMSWAKKLIFFRLVSANLDQGLSPSSLLWKGA